MQGRNKNFYTLGDINRMKAFIKIILFLYKFFQFLNLGREFNGSDTQGIFIFYEFSSLHPKIET